MWVRHFNTILSRGREFAQTNLQNSKFKGPGVAPGGGCRSFKLIDAVSLVPFDTSLCLTDCCGF